MLLPNKILIDEKNVMRTIENMTIAFHNGDIKGVMASYEENATVVFELEKPISDPVVLRKMFEGAFTLNPHFNYSGHEVFIANDVDINQSGLSVAMLRRQPDGKWLMVLDNPHGQNLMGKQ